VRLVYQHEDVASGCDEPSLGFVMIERLGGTSVGRRLLKSMVPGLASAVLVQLMNQGTRPERLFYGLPGGAGVPEYEE